MTDRRRETREMGMGMAMGYGNRYGNPEMRAAHLRFCLLSQTMYFSLVIL